MNSELVKYFTAFFFISYMGVAFVLPSVRTFRRTGINPITFGKSDNAHDYIGKLFKVVLVLIPLTIIIYWSGERIYQYLLPAGFLNHSFVRLAGIILCAASFIWTVIAQWQMGNSWRIGIDEQNKTELVTTGLFSISRNPIFFGMQLTLAGFFLLLPNAITLLVMISGCLLIQIQARLEEEFLSRQHGVTYDEYRKNVNRFI